MPTAVLPLHAVFGAPCRVEEVADGWAYVRLRAQQGHGEMRRACPTNSGAPRRWAPAAAPRRCRRQQGIGRCTLLHVAALFPGSGSPRAAHALPTLFLPYRRPCEVSPIHSRAGAIPG